jgi:hypothetical protein
MTGSEPVRTLANNNSVIDLKHSAAKVWLLGPGLQDLLRNTRKLAMSPLWEAYEAIGTTE